MINKFLLIDQQAAVIIFDHQRILHGLGWSAGAMPDIELAKKPFVAHFHFIDGKGPDISVIFSYPVTGEGDFDFAEICLVNHNYTVERLSGFRPIFPALPVVFPQGNKYSTADRIPY